MSQPRPTPPDEVAPQRPVIADWPLVDGQQIVILTYRGAYRWHITEERPDGRYTYHHPDARNHGSLKAAQLAAVTYVRNTPKGACDNDTA